MRSMPGCKGCPVRYCVTGTGETAASNGPRYPARRHRRRRHRPRGGRRGHQGPARARDAVDRDRRPMTWARSAGPGPARCCRTPCWPSSPSRTRSCSAPWARPEVPSGVLERGLTLRLRFEFDQYVNLRPVRLYPGRRVAAGQRAHRVGRHAGRPGGHRGPLHRGGRGHAQAALRPRSPLRRASTPRSASAGWPGTRCSGRPSGRAAS